MKFFISKANFKIAAFILGALFISQSVWAGGEKAFLRSDRAAKKPFLGEKMVYQISYLGFPVGKAEVEVKEIVMIRGREAYHIELKVRSLAILNWIYPVKDHHHSFIDKEHLHSLRYEKKISEGHYKTDEIMEYDQEKHMGYFFSKSDQSKKEMIIPKNVQDQISCGYWFRTQDIKPDSKIIIPVNADEKNWSMEIFTRKVKTMKIKGVGIFEAMETEPFFKFEGFFVKRGKVRGWVSLDERRIPLKMKVKIPVLGAVTATLIEYFPGEERERVEDANV